MIKMIIVRKNDITDEMKELPYYLSYDKSTYLFGIEGDIPSCLSSFDAISFEEYEELQHVTEPEVWGNTQECINKVLGLE